ncbi:MAG: multifunctional addition/repair protein, partial [Rhizobacter sp.]|nr:multifunctional addition/repair protein [Rhizobacter sp.]
HGNVHRSEGFGAAAVLRLLERCDALRRPSRFAELLLACECDARGRGGLEESPYPPRERLSRALRLVLAVDTAAVAAEAVARGQSGPAIGVAVQKARELALERLDTESATDTEAKGSEAKGSEATGSSD